MATGQVGKDPKIIVWDSETQQKISTISKMHERGILALGFSPDGSQLISVGMDNDHSLVLLDWKKGTTIASGRGSKVI